MKKNKYSSVHFDSSSLSQLTVCVLVPLLGMTRFGSALNHVCEVKNKDPHTTIRSSVAEETHTGEALKNGAANEV